MTDIRKSVLKEGILFYSVVPLFLPDLIDNSPIFHLLSVLRGSHHLYTYESNIIHYIQTIYATRVCAYKFAPITEDPSINIHMSPLLYITFRLYMQHDFAHRSLHLYTYGSRVIHNIYRLYLVFQVFAQFPTHMHTNRILILKQLFIIRIIIALFIDYIDSFLLSALAIQE